MKDLFVHFYGDIFDEKYPWKCLQFIHILNEYLLPSWKKVTQFPEKFLPKNVLKQIYLKNPTKIYSYKECCQQKIYCAFQLWLYTYLTMKQPKNYLLTHSPSEIKRDLNDVKNKYFLNIEIENRLKKFLLFKQNRPIQQVYYEYLKQDILMDLVLFRLFYKKIKSNELYSEELLLIKKCNYMFRNFLTSLAKQVKLFILKTRKED